MHPLVLARAITLVLLTACQISQPSKLCCLRKSRHSYWFVLFFLPQCDLGNFAREFDGCPPMMPCEVSNKLTFPVAELPCLRAKPNSVWTSWIPDSVFVSFSSFSWPSPQQCQPSVSPSRRCRCAVQRSDGRHCLPARLNLLEHPWEQSHPGCDAGWMGFMWVGEAACWEDKWEYVSWVGGRVKKNFPVSKLLWLLIETYE